MPPAAFTDGQRVPTHDTPILGMVTRPRVPNAVEYGNDTDFWVEYPSGLIDVSRQIHLPDIAEVETSSDSAYNPPPLKSTQLDIRVDGDRVVRVDKAKTALVVIDMQKWSDLPHIRPFFFAKIIIYLL